MIDENQLRYLDGFRTMDNELILEMESYAMENRIPILDRHAAAFLELQIKITKPKRVLEIGTGSGYQAAILINMGMRVFSIERQFDIYARTRKLFDDKNLNALLKFGDGTIGWEEFAPYEGIIVTAGSPSIPASLKKQLAIGGRLVIPVGDRSSQILTVITKVDENEFSQKEIPSFTFVPLIGREGWES